MFRTLCTLAGALLMPFALISPAQATVPYHAQSTHAVTFNVASATSGTTITCASSTLDGSATSLPAGPLLTVTGSGWGTCVLGGSGMPGTPVSVSHLGTWSFGPVTLGGIQLKIASNSTLVCSFLLTGSAAYAYAPPALTFRPASYSLTISSVVGCLGLVTNGEVVGFTGDYQVLAT